MSKLFAYHDVIATADDVKKKFAELNRDNYPMEVYQYILDVHTETENPVIDVIAWACDISYTPDDDEYYDDVCVNEHVICTDDYGVWYM